MNQALRGLADEWRRVAKAKFTQAKLAESKDECRFIEHGAVCYANCALQLSALLDANPVLDSALRFTALPDGQNDCTDDIHISVHGSLLLSVGKPEQHDQPASDRIR